MSLTMPPNAGPPVGPRGMAIRVAVQGANAYTDGAPANACPYGATRPYSRRAWVAGWTKAAIAAGAELPGLSGDVDHDTPWPGNDGQPAP